MTARLRSWWEKIKRHPIATVIITVAIALVALVLLGGYQFHWSWTGFDGNNKSGKTLWDWMQLLFIPVVLAVAGFWFNYRERKAAELRAEADRGIEQQRAEADRRVSIDNQREAALKEYIDKMSILLLHENLRNSEPEGEARKIARVLTLTVLLRLDGGRKRSILQFLRESGLIGKDNRIVSLKEADLSGAVLWRANLSEVDLSGADLSDARLIGSKLVEADLSGATLSRADLNEADLFEATLKGTDLSETDLSATFQNRIFAGRLREANLIGANLCGADLSGANLRGAILSGATLADAVVTPEQLEQAGSLKYATMPDGSKHP